MGRPEAERARTVYKFAFEIPARGRSIDGREGGTGASAFLRASMCVNYRKAECGNGWGLFSAVLP